MGLHNHAMEPVVVLEGSTMSEAIRLSDDVEADLRRIGELVASAGLTEDYEAWGRLLGSLHDAIVEENGFGIGWARGLIMVTDDPNSPF